MCGWTSGAGGMAPPRSLWPPVRTASLHAASVVSRLGGSLPSGSAGGATALPLCASVPAFYFCRPGAQQAGLGPASPCLHLGPSAWLACCFWCCWCHHWLGHDPSPPLPRPANHSGFIAKNTSGQVTTLKRNGSDYSATIIGALFQVGGLLAAASLAYGHSPAPLEASLEALRSRPDQDAGLNRHRRLLPNTPAQPQTRAHRCTTPPPPTQHTHPTHTHTRTPTSLSPSLPFRLPPPLCSLATSPSGPTWTACTRQTPARCRNRSA